MAAPPAPGPNRSRLLSLPNPRLHLHRHLQLRHRRKSKASRLCLPQRRLPQRQPTPTATTSSSQTPTGSITPSFDFVEDSITVTWNPPASGSVSHYILTRTQNNQGVLTTSTFRIDGTATRYIDNDVDFASTYDYVLTVHFNAPAATATSTPTSTPTATPTEAPTVTATPTATSEVANGSSDRAALVALYNSADGPNWVDNTNWLSSEPIGTWFGVTTDNNGRVTELRLKENGLGGSITVKLGQLSQLKVLDLSRNRSLGGQIPAELGNLSNLENLDLGLNSLTGAIQSELANLSELKNLDLSLNDLSGSIPSELGRLSNLVKLSLYHNGLSGSIPTELGNLSNLEGLYIHYAGISGTIPSQLFNLTRLKDLYLHYNELSGPIPSQLGNLTNLERLNLRQNNLSGAIPSQLGNLSRLRMLHLSWNELAGSLPSELSNLTNLISVRLAGNGALSGCIPAIWRDIPPGETYSNDLYRVGLPYCDTPEASAAPAPSISVSGGSGTASDPYIISDPTNVSSRSIRSYMLSWHVDHSVYFQWDVGDRAGEWTVSIDATPNSHHFDLFGRDDQGDAWDETGTSLGSGDQSITVSAQSGGHVYIRIKRRDSFNHPPIGLTLTIGPPALGDVPEPTPTATPTPTGTPATTTPTPTATPTPTGTPATTTPTPTATATMASSMFTSSGSGTSSDPYIITDPTSVSAHSIRSYVDSLSRRQFVYFRWDVGGRPGSWTVRIDTTPTNHDFDLFGRDDRGSGWDDKDTSRNGDENITIPVLSGGHILIGVKNFDGGAPTELTLTIGPPPVVGATATPTATSTPAASTSTPTATPTATSTPAASTSTPTATPTPTSTPAASTSTPTATPTLASSSFTSGGSGTESDPYIITDPTSVSSRSIRSYVSDLQARQSVYFRWDLAGDRVGTWRVSIDASPSSHDFDLYGRDDRDDQIGEWDDYGTSYYSGDEEIILYSFGQGHFILRVKNYDGGAPTDLTLTIEPPS